MYPVPSLTGTVFRTIAFAAGYVSCSWFKVILTYMNSDWFKTLLTMNYDRFKALLTREGGAKRREGFLQQT